MSDTLHMKRDDARKLSSEIQEQLRKQAIRLRKKGLTYKAIGEIVGVNGNTVWKWIKIYRQEGAAGIKAKKRGREYGTARHLDASQEAEIQQLITDKTPDQSKLTFALWTRQAVQELIQQRYGRQMPIRTVGEYLSRWGFTPQKPLKRAYEQRPAEVQKWLDESYPAIADRAKRASAEIHWGDETEVRSNCQHGRSYAPKGKTPVIRLSAKRSSINMISSVTNQGKVRFMLYQETMTAKVLIRFFKRLIEDATKKVFLILDNLRVHHAKVVRQWLAEHEEEIEVFYLPAYAPELNPDEYLNCDLKSSIHTKALARSIVDL